MIRKLPKDWKLRKLGEVTNIYKGGTPKRSVERYFEGDIAWATPTDITRLNGTLYIDDTEEHISEEALEKSSAKLLPIGTVLLTSRATIGKVVITRILITTNQGFTNFICKDEIVNFFLAYYLKSHTEFLISLGTGTTFLEVTKAALLRVEIPIPPLPTQHKIAAILSTYDDLIENNTRRIKILEDMAQTLYQEWFVHYRFPEHENVPLVESELGQIPQGWEVVHFSDILDLMRNGINPTKFPEEIFAHFSIPAFDNEHMPILHNGNSIKSSKYLVTKGCVLLSKLNPRIPRVWLPFINTEHRAISSTEFLILKPKLPVDCMFLYNLCRSPEFTDKFAVRALGTSGSHQRVKPDDFLNMSLIIPTKSLLNGFQKKVSPLVNICNTLRLKNANLRQTRDLLLRKLISGEIDVSELDINRDSTI